MTGHEGPAEALSRVRAPLFVPATTPRRFAKALASGADAVIIDCEDAVARAEKQTARETLAAEVPALAAGAPDDGSALLGVRVNGPGTSEQEADAAALAALAGQLDFVVVPMVSAGCDVTAWREAFAARGAARELPVIALIESSAGVLNAPEIARSQGVGRLALGPADLAQEWEIEPTAEEREFDPCRTQLVLASRAAGLPGPLDGPHLQVGDPAAAGARARATAALGMQGKLCIHPHQVAPVLEAFALPETERRRLERLVSRFATAEAEGVSSVRLEDGTFVDYPVYERALKRLGRLD